MQPGRQINETKETNSVRYVRKTPAAAHTGDRYGLPALASKEKGALDRHNSLHADAESDPTDYHQRLRWSHYWRFTLVTNEVPYVRSIPTVLSQQPFYPMTSPFAGLAVIITIEQFDGTGDVRRGCLTDERNFVKTLRSYGYEIRVDRNLTKADFNALLSFYATSFDFSDYDSFVLTISSHGRLGEVTCSDNEQVSLQRDVIDKIGPCRGLLGKPKHLWLQACQNPPSSSLTETDLSGLESDMHIAVRRGNTVAQFDGIEADEDFSNACPDRVPDSVNLENHPDMCVVLASADGLAYRHRDFGSFLPAILCRCLRYHGNDHDLESIVSFAVIPEVIKITKPLGRLRPVVLSSLTAKHQLRLRLAD